MKQTADDSDDEDSDDESIDTQPPTVVSVKKSDDTVVTPNTMGSIARQSMQDKMVPDAHLGKCTDVSYL